MSDECRFDSDADRNPLDEQTVTDDEPPPGAEPLSDVDGSTAEEAAEDEPQRARERRDGTEESIEADESEDG